MKTNRQRSLTTITTLNLEIVIDKDDYSIHITDLNTKEITFRNYRGKKVRTDLFTKSYSNILNNIEDKTTLQEIKQLLI